MSTQPIDYDALARQAGAVNVDPPTSTPQAAPSAPPKAGAGAVDYDALARQAGAVDVQPLTQATTTPTAAEQAKYRQDTAAGPFTRPGAAERVMDVTSPEAIQNMEIGAGATLAVPAAFAAIPTAGQALYELAVKHLAGNVLPGMEEQAAHAKLLELAPKVYKVAKELGLGAGGLTLLWKALGASAK